MLKPDDKAPPFDLPCANDGRIERLSLRLLKSEMIVLFFYPRDFSFICPTEIVGCHQMRADFAAEKTQVIGASVDDAETHLRWAQELGGIGYPLLADEGGVLAKAYGVFDENEGVAKRATFILNAERRVVYAVASAYNVGRSVIETLRVVRALRTGRMCPADWTPGQPVGPADRKY